MLRGEVPLLLRAPSEAPRRARKGARRAARAARQSRRRCRSTPPACERFAALKAWRAEVAREHNLPAYVVFHDATLAEMADPRPDSLDALAEISGVGAKKLEAYGARSCGCCATADSRSRVRPRSSCARRLAAR